MRDEFQSGLDSGKNIVNGDNGNVTSKALAKEGDDESVTARSVDQTDDQDLGKYGELVRHISNFSGDRRHDW